MGFNPFRPDREIKKIYEKGEKEVRRGIKSLGGGGDNPDFQTHDTYPAIPRPKPIPMPAPPDMSEYYKVMAENQAYQNRIAGQQLDIAKRQLGIGEETYAKSKEYRPIEKDVIAQAQRGLDPSVYAARARAAILQQVAGGPQQLMAAQQARGVSPSSPAAVAALQRASRQTGEQIAGVSQAEKRRIEDLNMAMKGQAVGIGAKIPEQAVAGYSMAGHTAGQAGAIAQQAATALANQYATEQQTNMAYQQLAANTAMANAQLQLQYQGLQQQIAQSRAQQEWQEWQARQQTEQAKWGMVPIVGPIAYGVKEGTHICTELLRQGLVDENLYRLALCFDRTLPYETVQGYQRWALPVSRAMRRSRVLTALIRPLAVSYMTYAASSFLGLPRPLLGAVVYHVGAPICNLIGRICKFKTYSLGAKHA